MKEVIAIIRMNKMEDTKEALAATGFPSFVAYRVLGRGKQKGLQIPYPPQYTEEEIKDKKMKFIPKRMISIDFRDAFQFIGRRAKRMISIVVEDEFVPAVVSVLMRVNKTGNVGDGKIFVCPIDDVVRIRTGERGKEAL